MKTIIVDISKAKFIGELHQAIHQAFQSADISFPDFYGNNLDALWDCLTGFIEIPIEITLVGLDSLHGDLLAYAEKIVAVFAEAAQETPGITFKFH